MDGVNDPRLYLSQLIKNYQTRKSNTLRWKFCSSKFTFGSSEQDYENAERESKLDLNELFEDGQRLPKEDTGTD